MINSSNLCVFEGTMTKDPQISTAGQGQNTYQKALFTVTVPRKLTKEQRQAKQNGQQVTGADFPQFVANGTIADVIDKYFPKGKAIKVIASYQTYTSQDTNGNTKYGSIFKVEEVGFVVNDTQEYTQSNGGGNSQPNNGGNNNRSNNNNNNNSRNNNNNSRNNARNVNPSNTYNQDYVPVSDDDIPF